MLVSMTIRSPQFPPLSDRLRFPILTSGAENPCGHLLGCASLTFFAPEDASTVSAIILNEPLKWHQYGDTRWPSLSSWIEIETSAAGFLGYSGVLVTNYEIPRGEADAFQWISQNGPLQDLFPQERSDAAVVRRLQALREQSSLLEEPDDPSDSPPRFVQSYCIYRGPQETRLIATYTDLLNDSGVPIPRFRMANVKTHEIETCRFTLHALFRLNQARFAGMPFSTQHRPEVGRRAVGLLAAERGKVQARRCGCGPRSGPRRGRGGTARCASASPR